LTHRIAPLHRIARQKEKMNTRSSSMDTPSKKPDSSSSSSPEGDSRGTEEATSPSWAHVVRREASVSAVSATSFNRPRAIGGQQARAPEPVALGGKGASPGEQFQIRTEGKGIGSGCNDDVGDLQTQVQTMALE
jgi:hypothetical protein